MKNNSESESEETREDNGGRRFRIKVCMKEFFSDERAQAYMCVYEHHRVRWLHRRLRTLFALPPRFVLTSRGYLLPPDEPLEVLQRDDTVDVMPARDVIDGISHQSTPMCKNLASNGVVSALESRIGDSDTVTPTRTDLDKVKSNSLDSKDDVDATAAFVQHYKEDALQERRRRKLADAPDSNRADRGFFKSGSLESANDGDTSAAFTPLYEDDEVVERRPRKLPDSNTRNRRVGNNLISASLESKNDINSLETFIPFFKEDELQERKRRALAMLEQFCGEPENVPRVGRPRRRRVRRRRRVASLPDTGDNIAPATEDCTSARSPSPELNESKQEHCASVLRNGCHNSRPPRVIRPLDESMS